MVSVFDLSSFDSEGNIIHDPGAKLIFVSGTHNHS